MKSRTLSIIFFAKSILLVLTFGTSNYACAQKEEPKVVQFSGLVMTSDSLQAIPFTHVTIRNRGRVATANHDGYFSFAAQAGDTLYFTCVGFKPAVYVLNKVLEKNNYSIIQLMTRDNIWLPGTIVYPWGDKDGFKRAFRELRVPKDDLQRAEENMDPQLLMVLAQQLQPSGSEASSNALRSSAAQTSYWGQQPANNLLNPFAWYSLYKAAKNGDLKVQQKSDLPPLKDE